ncbi:MAG: Cof-type HAD-IIB family hydrolase [Sphaerochaeta sp.]
MKEIKLICTDIDGTLLNDEHKINDLDKKMLKKAVEEKNIPLILTSGRFKSGLTNIQKDLGFSTGISCFNGCYIESDEVVLRDVRLNIDNITQLLPIIKSNGSFPILNDLEHAYMEGKGDFYHRLNSFFPNTSVSTSFDKLLKKWEKINYSSHKIIVMDKDPNNLLITKKLLDNSDVSGISTFLSAPTILEIVPYGVTKANTLDIMCEKLNITKENVMSFGDFNNDIEMIAESGYGIAMKNAIDEVKSVAFDVTLSNNENGIANAINKYIF